MAGEMNQMQETDLGKAIVNNNICQFFQLLPLIDPFFIDNKGNTYLHFLATLKRPYIFHALAATGIEVNHQNKDGNTALHVSALHGEPFHVSDLYAYGVDPYIYNKDGKTARELHSGNQCWIDAYERFEPGLWRAVEGNDTDMVRRLLGYWCKTDIAKQAVYFVHQKRRVKVIKTIRQLACELPSTDVVSMIDECHHTLMLMYGVLENDVTKMKYALERTPCNVNFMNKASSISHVLQHALILQNLEMVHLLCKDIVPGLTTVHSVADINMTVLIDSYVKAPLFFEVLKPQYLKDLKYINAVFSSRPDLSLRDERGRSALTYSMDRTQGELSIEVAKALLDKGMDISARDVTGSTARDVARFARRTDIVDAIDRRLVHYIQTSDVATLKHLAVSGYDDALYVTYHCKDSIVLAAGNDTNDVTFFYEWLQMFQNAAKKIHRASCIGDLISVKELLLDSKLQEALIHAKDQGGRSPLMLALLHGQDGIAAHLLDTYTETLLTDTDHHGRCAAQYLRACAPLLSACSPLMCHINSHLHDSGAANNNNFMVPLDVELEKKVVYGMRIELQCLDKYEELLKIIKSQRKNGNDFAKALQSSEYSVATMMKTLNPQGCLLVKDFQDLLLVAQQQGKEDIARQLRDERT